MKKKIGVVINKPGPIEDFFIENLKEVFGNTVSLSFYYLNQMRPIVDMDVILVMTKERVLGIIPYVEDTTKILPITRTISRDMFDAVSQLSEFGDLLVVNDTVETTMNLITTFYKVGIQGIRFIPYTPDQYNNGFKMAITANEGHLVPSGMDFLDIGFRPLDISTFLEMMNRLGMSYKTYEKALEEYYKHYIPMDRHALASIEMNKTVERLNKAVESKSIEQGFSTRYSFDSILTGSAIMEKKINKAKKLAPHDINILIYGESGTGKEMFAQGIHAYSKRSSCPFIGVNVTAIPSNLLESELFGYVEGAFTGAKKSGYKGIFEQCNGGTLFLDEIGDMHMELQGKLLRVLEERQIRPVGGHSFIEVDVRIITATNKNLLDEITKGNFREDLYYRLKAATIKIPPLRERMDDFELLVQHFIKNTSMKFNEDALMLLRNYPWYGNIRELRNVCAYIDIMDEDKIIGLEDLPDDLLTYDQNRPTVKTSVPDENLYMNQNKAVYTLESIEKLSMTTSSVGRLSIIKDLEERSITIGEGEMKSILQLLKENGYILQQRGRKGAVLTEKGLDYLNKNRM